MRIDLDRWLFIGMAGAQQSFFEAAQEMGGIEFVPMHTRAVDPQDPYLLRTKHLSQAVALVQRWQSRDPMRATSSRDSTAEQESDIDAETLAIELVNTYGRLEALKVQMRQLRAQQELLLPLIPLLGSKPRSTLQQLSQKTRRSAQLLTGPEKGADPNALFLGDVRGKRYFLWIPPQPLCPPEGYEVVDFEKDPAAIERELTEALDESQRLHQKMAEGVQALPKLQSALISATDALERKGALASTQTALDQQIFIASGWVGINRRQELEALAARFNLSCSRVAPLPQETTPTYLENKGVARLGQELVAAYDAPAATDSDPSLWVLCSFVLFFAMIVNDAIYGALLLAGGLYGSWRFKCSSGSTQRFLQLTMILGLVTCAWGMITSSFLGIEVAPNNPLRRYSPLHSLALKKAAYHARVQDSLYQEWVHKFPQVATSNDGQKLLEVCHVDRRTQERDYFILKQISDSLLKEWALWVGVCHLLSSLLRYSRRTWASGGWVLVLIGGWLLIPARMEGVTFVQYLFDLDPEHALTVGYYLVGMGLALSLLMSCIQNRWRGLMEWLTLIQLFGDALSYLRLYALGMAGGIMASSFNEISQQAPIWLTPLVLLLGHLSNFILGIMGGVIHGLRLNFIEWYHYSFVGGGRWHRPLKKN